MAMPRPTLVTTICIYEGLAGLFILGGEALSQFLFYAVSPGAHALNINPVRTFVTLASALLSFGISITFWNLRRQAFFLSLLKVFLGLFEIASVLYVLTNSRFHTTASLGRSPFAPLVVWLPRLFEAMFLVLGIAITMYIYRMTISPRPTLMPPGTTDRNIP